MSNAAQIASLKSAILAFASKIKQLSLEAQNAQQLEGLSLQQVVELISGATESTIADVESSLNTFIARRDNPNQVTQEQVGLGSLQNFAIATAEQALDSAVANAYMTPERTWEALLNFWASKVGAAPETLDTLEELAAAFQNNPDIITALQDQVANKATKTELNTATAAIIARLDAFELSVQETYATKAELAAQAAASESAAAQVYATKTEMQAVDQRVTDLIVVVDNKANAEDVTSALVELQVAFQDALTELES